MIVGIQNEILKIQSLGLLDRLLKDKTTKTNIIWGTDAYKERGKKYERDQEIKVELITGNNSDVIKNRARKELEHQAERTRAHAEVFTPLWICKKMNDETDVGWFYKSNPHPFSLGGNVSFLKSRKWNHYVDSRVLEITCGEAPYLVSRYDVSTGESIPIAERTGLLDRKLRVINENTDTEAEWIKWTIRSFQSTYGYEFQGDNLLIARVNLLMTFEEYLFDRWKRKPTSKEYQTITNTVAWNIWQMDGLTGCIPYCKAEEDTYQMSIFDYFDIEQDKEDENRQPPCRIYNWRRDNSFEFMKLEEGRDGNMKFDFIIGNPPYMEETDSDSTRMPPIYDKFMEASYKVGDKVELITPARFLFNAGYTPKKWNEKMLSDEHFQVLYYEPNATNIFPNTDIKGGVAITYHDITTEYEPIRIFSKYPEQNQILRKVSNMHPASFTELVYPALSYKATKVMTLENRQLLEKQKSKSNPDPKELRFRTSAFNVLEEIFFENKPSDGKEYIRIIGLKDSKRTYRWVDKRYISCPDNFEYYKVIMPKSNGSGQISDVISSPLVGNPGLGHTQTFISIGKFNSELEANNCLKYIKTKFARVMLSVKKITQDNPPETWRFVPQQDFSQSSDINWNGSIHEIDMQLYAKYKLTDKEIQFVEDNVKEME